MVDRCNSARPQTGADEISRREESLDPDGEPSRQPRPCPKAYRAEAAGWERAAQQISFIPHRDYFLSVAHELRAKAAALEAACCGGEAQAVPET